LPLIASQMICQYGVSMVSAWLMARYLDLNDRSMTRFDSKNWGCMRLHLNAGCGTEPKLRQTLAAAPSFVGDPASAAASLQFCSAAPSLYFRCSCP
jgi:hypothetical protein